MTPLADEALRADARRNLALILDAAREVFAGNGLSAGVAEVARRAGVGNATIFRRFPQKEDLIAAVVERVMRERIDEETSQPAAGSPGAALRGFMERMIDWQLRDRALLECMPAGVLADPRLEALQTELSELAARLVAAAQRSGEVRDDIGYEDVVVLGMAVAHTAAELQQVGPDLWRRYLSVVLDGLRPGGGELPGHSPAWTSVCAGKAAAHRRARAI